MEPETERLIAELRARVETLEAQRDILQRLYMYGPALDYGQEEAFVECFTDDGIFEGMGHPRHKSYQGGKQLAAFAAQHTRAPAHIHKHCVIDPVIDVRGNEASSTAYFARLDLEAEGPVVHAFGRYHDELLKEADESWRFARRTCEIEALVD